MAMPCDLQVVENLREMFVRQRLRGLQFHDQLPVNDEICEILANLVSIDIEDLETLLRLDDMSGLLQSMDLVANVGK